MYPPMSTLLEKQGIELIQGYDASQLDPQPDLVIIGNAMTRGNPCVEAVLGKKHPLYVRSTVAARFCAARPLGAGTLPVHMAKPPPREWQPGFWNSAVTNRDL